jgi:urease alpha subunit
VTITTVLVVKADLGVKAGRICAIGKSGNPQTMDRITPGLKSAWPRMPSQARI